MDASAFSSLSAVARSCLAMWGAQFFIFEGAPFRLSLKSMPLAKIFCKRHFHMSGEMVPPQYSPSDTTSARSPLAVVQRAPCQKRGFDAARYQVARKRGSARQVSSIFSFCIVLVLGSLMRIPWQPENNASNRNGRIQISDMPFLILAIFGFRRVAAA